MKTDTSVLKSLDKVWNSIIKIERYFFLFFVLVNAIPVLFCTYFPTVDGPAHLYNANIISELLKNENGFLSSFYSFNTFIPPNLTGHFILVGLLSVFPGYIAEKIILLIFLFGLPLGLRHIFKSLENKNLIILYFIFPFTYSFLFYYGSFNFNLAIVLLLFGLSYSIRFRNKSQLKSFFVNLFFCTIISFTHIFVFAIFLLFLFLESAYFYINIYFQTKKFSKTSILKIVLLFFAALPGLVLSISYILVSPAGNAESNYLQTAEIINSITKISPLVSINFGRTTILAQWMFYTLCCCFFYHVLVYIPMKIKKEKYIFNNIFWFILSIICLTIFFFIPDSRGVETGFIVSRFIIFFFIVLFIWLGGQKPKRWFSLVILINILFLNFAFLSSNYKSTRSSCDFAKELVLAGNYIDAESIVFPITISDNFIFGHISNYLGVEKSIVITDNYEAGLIDFPIVWNYSEIPDLKFGNIIMNNQKHNIIKKNKDSRDIDYVIIINDSELQYDAQIERGIIEILNNDYQIVFQSEKINIILFKLI